ncbi:MAG: hypothetical protein ACPHGY_04045 [Rhodospirillaceae bacterium]|jgi:hypothetical protein
MESYLVWGYIHILLFVFWLGADVGVFLSAVYAKKSELSFETRATIMKLGLIIDFLPRICFALIFPVGLHLALALGLYDVQTWLFVAGWGIGIGWIALVMAIGKNEGTPLAEKLSLVQFWLEGLLGTFYVGVGLWSLLGNGPLQEGWFAVKILLFGFVFYCAMAIDICFRPFIKPFMELADHGSTPEREAIITKTINNTLVAVLTMYALIAIVAFLGKVKPF